MSGVIVINGYGKYRTVDAPDMKEVAEDPCEGCAAQHDIRLCSRLPRCVAEDREDNRDVIYIKDKS